VKKDNILSKLSKDDLKEILISLSQKETNPKKWLENKVEEYLDKKICDSYSIREEKRYLYNRFTGEEETCYTLKVGFCKGTKECDICNCGGNRNRCDFY